VAAVLTSELDYELPPELIAQHPVVPRDYSRLLVYDRKRRHTWHKHVSDLPTLLRPGDILVYNDSRVIKARIYMRKSSGGRVELLFLRRHRGEVWEALARPSSKLKPGMELHPDGTGGQVSDSGAGAGRSSKHDRGAGGTFKLREHLGQGRWLVDNLTGTVTEELLEREGEMPLPPYIHEPLRDMGEYQTVFAETPGSAAAPTAGLHFTGRLIGRIREAGIALAPLTLHIGLDTFRPIDEDELELHRIHSERYRLPAESYQAINAARKRNGRVVSVGTTAARVLETVYGRTGASLEGETDLFITPGCRFTVVDALLTNFHLPRSTLLAMVMAFAGEHETRKIYHDAVKREYRFYSFGDAMLLL
jgi:S-adenosylmethionine:tRNA ribosyltransferase-isomerase